MKVKLLAHTPEPEKVISMAAKLCYSPVGVDEIAENLTEESINKFLNMLVSMGHESPIEHVTFTFGIEGISRSCSHQIVRHRIASFSQQSQRYVKLDQFEYIIPPEIEKNEKAKETLKEVYEALVEKGYNPINQIVGYILSGDPTYITSHNNARNKIRTIERDELLEKMVRNFIDLDK